jgi:hypothetical protein
MLEKIPLLGAGLIYSMEMSTIRSFTKEFKAHFLG